MNLFWFELENSQILPLQRISENLIQEAAMNSNDEGFIGKPRVNVFAFCSSKRNCGKRLLPGLGFRRVLGGKGTQRHLQLWLIQAVLWQIGSHVFDEFCDLLIL